METTNAPGMHQEKSPRMFMLLRSVCGFVVAQRLTRCNDSSVRSASAHCASNKQSTTHTIMRHKYHTKQLHGAPREQRNTFAPACNPVAGNDVRRVAGNDVRAGQRDVEMAICAPARAMYTTNCERSRVRTVSRAQGLACVLSCVRAGLPSAAAASARLAACGRVWPQV